MYDLSLRGCYSLVWTPNRRVCPKNREALFKLVLDLQALGEDIVTLSLASHMFDWCDESISSSNMIDMFLQENQLNTPFNLLRNLREDKIYDCFLQSTDSLWLSRMLQSLETACLLPVLEGVLQGEPWKPVYEIGERITLSCPHGMQLEGARSVLCEPSLKWSPDMKTIQCKRPGKPLQSSKCNAGASFLDRLRLMYIRYRQSYSWYSDTEAILLSPAGSTEHLSVCFLCAVQTRCFKIFLVRFLYGFLLPTPLLLSSIVTNNILRDFLGCMLPVLLHFPHVVYHHHHVSCTLEIRLCCPEGVQCTTASDGRKGQGWMTPFAHLTVTQLIWSKSPGTGSNGKMLLQVHGNSSLSSGLILAGTGREGNGLQRTAALSSHLFQPWKADKAFSCALPQCWSVTYRDPSRISDIQTSKQLAASGQSAPHLRS